MADAWWLRHRASLLRAREPIPVEQPRPTGLWEALREFFIFLGTAIRNAPGQWLERKKRDLAAGVARRVTNAVFGQGSAYTVVVSGVTGDGMPAGWLEIGRAVGEVEAALDAAGLGLTQESSGELGALWEDFTAAGLTLADGAERVEGLPPVQVDGGIGVIREAWCIAPTDAQSFTEMSGQLSAVVDLREVRPCDVLTRYDLQRRLSAHARDDDIQLDVAAAQESLRRWQSSTQGTFAVRVAEHVGKAQLDTQAEIAQLLAALDDRRHDSDRADEALQRRLARRMRLLLGLLVVLLIAVGVVTGIGLIGLGLGVGVGALAALLGVGAMARTFYVQQKHVFQMLHRAEAQQEQSAIALRNLRAAMRDLRRQVQAYSQLQVWARVLASFLTAPFGRFVQTEVREPDLAGPFPRGLRVGDIVPQADAMDRVASELRRELFSVGWSSAPWAALVSSASRVGAGSADRPDTPRALYNCPALDVGGAQTFLQSWGERIVREGPSTVGGDEVWSAVSDELNNTHNGLSRLLTAHIRVQGGTPGIISADEFLGAMQHPESTTYLDGGILGAAAATRGAGHVVTRVPSGRIDGLARSVSLTELSGEVAHYEFAGRSASTQAASSSRSTDTFAAPDLGGLGSSLAAGEDAGQTPASEAPAATDTGPQPAPQPDPASPWTFGSTAP